MTTAPGFPDGKPIAKQLARQPARGQATVLLEEGELAVQELNAGYPRVVLRGRARQHRGDWLVSLFLVNAQHKPSGRGDAYWLFQVEFKLTAPDREPVFLPRPESVSGGDAADRAEQRRLAMAHRHAPEFATGHGAAVHVTTVPGDPMRAVEVRTEAVPSCEVPFTDVPAVGTVPARSGPHLRRRGDQAR